MSWRLRIRTVASRDFPSAQRRRDRLVSAVNLHHLQNADPNAREPSALRLELTTSGDTVSIVATVLYGEFDSGKAMGSVENIPHQTIATHTVKFNSEVTFPELERVGLEPITFRIAPAQSAAPYHPILRSNAPSVQIDDYTPVDRVSGLLTVHNLSGKAVVAYRVGTNSDGGSGFSEETMARIASGETGKLNFSDSSQAVANGTCLESPKSAMIVLQAALFDDGSYEGNMRIAADLVAHRLGHDLQRQRIQSLAEPILANSDLDVGAMIERIRAAIKQLTVEPDTEALARLRTQFPGLAESACAGLALEVSNQMKVEKESTDQELQRYETDTSTRKSPVSFARWWALAM